MAKLRCSFLLLAAAAALAGAPQLSAQTPTTKPAPTTKPVATTIAVVDLETAIDNYGVAIKERERLQKMSSQFSDQLDAITKNIEELRAQLTLLRPGTNDYANKEFELQSLARRRDDTAQFMKRQFDTELEAFELRVYEDLEFAIAKVARDRGVAIVLRKQETLDLAPEEAGSSGLQQARHRQFTRRTVWFTDESVDLTPALVKYLQVFDPRAERLAAAKKNAQKNPMGQPKGAAAKPTRQPGK
ncbi:MAG: OmpH family outer membrane protein [bacterium]|nr:OmpH family outer membrane protein [bacterium]